MSEQIAEGLEQVGQNPQPVSDPVTNTETPPAAEENKEPPAPKTFTQEDVDRIVTKRLTKAERNFERRQQQLMGEILSRIQPQNQPPQPQEDAEPDPAKFENVAEYLREVARYEARKTIKGTEAEAAKRREAVSEQTRNQSVESSIQAKFAVASEKYDDFDEVVMDSSLPVTPYMAEAISESDIGGEIAYYLGKNRAEAARIAALSPIAAAREIGKIEAKLSAAPVQQPQVSKAPPPPEPVGGGSSAFSKDPDKMSVEEWTNWRNEQINKQRRR